MYGALISGADATAIGQALSREDRLLLAEYGDKARLTCWTKAFVLTVARKLTDFVAEGQDDEQLRFSVEGMFATMDGLFSRLPNGITLELADLAMDIYNEACANLAEVGDGHLVPANVVGQGYAAFLRRKASLAAD